MYALAALYPLGTLRVESIKQLPETDMNISVRDADGEWAPVLLVKTELKGLGFTNVSRPTKHAATYDAGRHEYKFYMNANQRVIEITHAEYEPLEVRLLADYGIEAKPKRAYELILTNLPEKEYVNAVILSEPTDAHKIIDGKDLGTGQSFELACGTHTLKLTKSGYRPITREIEVSQKNTVFNNLTLAEVEPVMITITSEPREADIYINNVNEGKTNKQLFKFPDSYELRLVKDKYDTVEKTITVSESGSNTFAYTLQKNTSVLTINTMPSNCDIYLNNEKLSGNCKEVSAGMYRVEVKKTGYFSQSRTVTVSKGRNKTETFTLKQQTGKLQFVVEPMEAEVVLKQNGRTVQSWNGSKYLSSLAIGSYTVEASLGGYKSQTTQLNITLDETTKVNIAMEKGTSNHSNSNNRGNGTTEMVFVQGGSFKMGSNDGDSDEKPVHSVAVDAFYIGKYEVTQKEWKDVMGNNPSYFKGDNLPVEKVSWYDAVEFCNKKSRAEGLTPCYSGIGENIKCNFSANGYRLPTEAEWEYAARGGNKSKGYKYAGSNSIADVAWYDANSGQKTHTIGTKLANELALFDMTGNVWEWCYDFYIDDYYKKSPFSNPQGARFTKVRSFRGGSWSFSEIGCRIVNRLSYYPDCSLNYIGFRLARSVE
jgi:formylglycine-generating enzyme required for sulfatase activity